MFRCVQTTVSRVDIYIAYSVYISHTNAYMYVLYVLVYIFVIHIHLANCRVKRQR